jgi:hypothetical protein
VSSEPCYRCGCPVVVTDDDYEPLCEACESGLLSLGSSDGSSGRCTTGDETPTSIETSSGIRHPCGECLRRS